MSEKFDQILDRYRTRATEEARIVEAAGPDIFRRRDEFLLEIGEDVGQMLRALAVARGAKRLVELGTSYGFSTLFLADAARQTGGTVLTFELSDYKQAFAREQIEEAGLSDHVEWCCGDALELLAQTQGGIDFVLIDLWKELYIPCLDLLHDKLTDGAIIAADNMLFPPNVRSEADMYRAAVRAKPDMQTMLLPIGQGIELSCVWRSRPD